MREKSIQILRQLQESFSGADSVPDLTGVKQDICSMVQGETDIMPMLSERWTQMKEAVRQWKTRMTDATGVKEVADLLPEAIDLLYYKRILPDYYATVNEETCTWDIPYRHEGLREHVIYNEDQYEKFMGMIKRGENFALMRGGDGEYAVMEGRHIQSTMDLWHSPDHMTTLGEALKDSLRVEGENIYYGISCPCCDPKVYFYYMQHIRNKKNVTFGNLWVNCNFRRFRDDFANLSREAVVIGNHEGQGRTIGKLNVLKYYPVSDDCVSFWEEEGSTLISRIIDDFGDRNNLLYVVSAGPMSGPLIAALYKNNPENTYIDVGSAVSNYIHGRPIRPYMLEGDSGEKKMCWMPKPENTPRPAVTVVMTLYKRPEALIEQLEALERQTLRPQEILLIQDAVENGVYHIELEETIKKRFTDVRICKKNEGVWERFSYASEKANCDMICLLDDDTIPGDCWLENCYMHMIQKEAIYVTVGITMMERKKYPAHGYFRSGWAAPEPFTTEVDYGGHSWFVKKEHLKTMLEDCAEIRDRFQYAGEDMWLSFSNLKKHDIRTVVPYHCVFDMSFWGSIPDSAYAYGNQRHAISNQKNGLNYMREALDLICTRGWDMVVDRRASYAQFTCAKVQDMEINAFLMERQVETDA